MSEQLHLELLVCVCSPGQVRVCSPVSSPPSGPTGISPRISAEVGSMSDGESTHLRDSTIRAPIVPARGAVAGGLGWTMSSLNGRPLSNVANSDACAGESLSHGISTYLMSSTRFAAVAKYSAQTVRTCRALL
jgi:hypothetical protein